MAKSDTILGRFKNRLAFSDGGKFSVAAYRTLKGRLRYSDAGPSPWAGRKSTATVYRVNVTPKPVILTEN